MDLHKLFDQFVNRNKTKNIEEDNYIRLQKAIASAKDIRENPNWKVLSYAVGGLEDVGFSKNYPDLLLILSSQGRGVLDCKSEKIIARDRDYEADYMNFEKLIAKGIGPIADEEVPVSGIHGGGLHKYLPNAVSLEILAPDWPYCKIFLNENNSSIFDDQNHSYIIYSFDYPHTFGFSPNGKYIIIASSSGVELIKRRD